MVKNVIVILIFAAINCFLTAFFAFNSSGGYQAIYTVLAWINGSIAILLCFFIVCCFTLEKGD
jgi:hypothetical protein